MQSDKFCQIVEQYLAYLITIKGRSKNTVLKYRLDLLQFFKYVATTRGERHPNFQLVNIDFIHSISLGDMYGFLLGNFGSISKPRSI